MYKKLLLLLIVISLVAAVFISYQRYQVERTNKTVELILDFNQWQKLNLPNQVRLAELLKRYEDLGITSVAIFEQDINDLIEAGEIDLVTKAEIKLMKKVTNGSSKSDFPSFSNKKKELIYIFYDRLATKEKLKNKLIDYLGEDKIVGINQQSQVITIQAGKDRLKQLPVGFSKRELELVMQSDLNLIPRFSNKEVTNSELIRDKFAALSIPASDLSQIIFAGDEVLGYPNYLKTTQALLQDHKLKLGVIEPFIAFQEGVNQLASSPQIGSLRVHSVQQEEFEKLSISKLVDRYLRAVKERKARGLYLKPILQEKQGQSAFKLTNEFLTKLVTELKAAGYSLGEAQSVSKFSTGKISLLMMNLGVLAALFYLVEYLFIANFPVKITTGWKVILFSLVSLISGSMIWGGYILFNREIFALLIAIIFPTLAIIVSTFSYVFSARKRESDDLIKSSLLAFLKASLITISGGILLIGVLGDWRYMLKVRQFRGIKLAFLGPILLLFLYYLHYRFWLNKADYNFKYIVEQAKNWLNKNIKLKHILFLFFIVVTGIIYIGRTGNDPMISVPDFEIIIRHWLEDLFLVRPRFKSFLIGHPLFLIGVWLILRQYRNWGLPLIFGGLIGQITMINTISHIHTPLLVSSLRVSLGLGLGIGIGLLLVKVVSFLIDRWQRLRKELA